MKLIEILLTYLIPPIAAAVAGWFVGRRKQTAEAAQSEIENVEKALGIYRGIITDLTEEVKKLKIEVTSLIQRCELIEAENRQLKNR